MEESYKGHVIEIRSEERDGMWWASSSIKPRVGAISGLTDAGPSIGFDPFNPRFAKSLAISIAFQKVVNSPSRRRDTGDRCDPVFGFFPISLLYGEKVKSVSPCVTRVTPEHCLTAYGMVGGIR